MNPLNQSDDSPVTVEILEQVKPGCEDEFERLLSDILVAAAAFEGHLGVNIFRPNDRSNREYRIVFKFDHLSNLTSWENSPIRHRLLERIKRLTVGSEYQRLTGLETWFTLPIQGAIVPPPRYKMVLVTWLVIFPLINIIPPFLNQLLFPWPTLLRSAIGAAFMVSLMTYVIMPRATKLFAKWLYPK
ncbi:MULTISPECIES: antibiotic biosynthesis monooxygenase [unclassified Microcoleus]|uniref:antibiotic biosynthesis monooxygenase n=1 Tax=unclassified Microcoleus TaxID=2642155 RepID=UPI00312BB097